MEVPSFHSSYILAEEPFGKYLFELRTPWYRKSEHFSSGIDQKADNSPILEISEAQRQVLPASWGCGEGIGSS